ncbi:MAG: glycosyltransferase family 4 protein [Terracidiphilus sp.]
MASTAANPVTRSASVEAHLPRVVVGVTHPQTCLTLTGRLRALREAGFEVTLLCSPGELADGLAAAEGVRRVIIPMERGIAPLADLVSLIRLWRSLRRLRPALVEFSTPKAGLLGSLAARMLGIPVRIYVLRGLKLETSTGLKHRMLLSAERTAAACAHLVLCNSESLRTEARALGIAPRDRLHLLGEGSSNGVDTVRFHPGENAVRVQLGIAASHQVIGFVGRLTRDKGLPELVEAFDAILKEHPSAWLLLVGFFDAAEDALDPDLRRRIEAHPRIKLTGFVADTAPYYRAMDLLVLPTWREGFPNVVLEAGASGIPVVTTLSTGSRDAVVPEVTGLLIPPGYPQAIREAVLKLLGDPERRRRMGLAAREWVTNHFMKDRVLGLTTALYKRLLAESSEGNEY